MPKLVLDFRSRDNAWLFGRLCFIWSKYFADMPQMNLVLIRFGRYSKLRLGSIRLDKESNKTHIIITSMFKNLQIPQDVVDHTIAHELCHYAHGFSSPRAQLYRYPHEGGVIKKEMEKRDLMHLFEAYRKWIKTYRLELKEAYKNKIRVRRRKTIWRWI